MAKMFYTLEEVCEKLGKTQDEVKHMIESGQIQEFRDRDKLMFKVDQIDMLAGGEEDTGEVKLELEDTSGGSGLGLAEESSIGLVDSREGTGISVFDTDHGEQDAEEQTHAGEVSGVDEEEEEELSLEAVGSGSGLLDLTRESDDTSLGAELLEEVYSGEQNIEIPANASGLFEAAGTEAPTDERADVPSVTVPMVVESYDGAGSGLGAGLMIGALVALVCAAIVAIVGTSGATPGLAIKFGSNLWMWVGGLFGVTLVLGLVGLFIGKASE
ncbi:MAG: helix-turn-helix domain-containing protein [Planctomycetota bacterium]|jgi:hypothetical protein